MIRYPIAGSLLIASALGAPLVASAAQQAVSADEAVKGIYVGGAIGQARYDDNFDLGDIDREDTSWKAIVGWRFLDQFAVEAAFVDFGDTTAPAQLGLNPYAASAKAWSVHAVGFLPVPYVDLFAKVGAARLEADAQGPNFTAFSEHATKFAYGWGAQWRWRSLAIRGEYERFDSNAIGDVDMISVGATYTLPITAR